MEIRSEPHFTLTIVLSDEEAKSIILDPDQFLSQLQDAIAPNGDYARRAAQSDGPARRGEKRANKGRRTIGVKRHCNICNRDIAPQWWNKHMMAKHGLNVVDMTEAA